MTQPFRSVAWGGWRMGQYLAAENARASRGLLGKAMARIEVCCGYHQYWPLDCLIAGNNPVLNTLALLRCAEIGRTLLLVQDQSADRWNYALLKHPGYRAWINQSSGIQVSNTEMGAWANAFFEASANRLAALAPMGLYRLTDWSLQARHGADPIVSGRSLFVLHKPVDQSQASRAAADGPEKSCRQAFARYIEPLIVRLMLRHEPQRMKLILARQTLLTSVMQVFQPEAIRRDAENDKIDLQYLDPLITPFGMARHRAADRAGSLADSLEDVRAMLEVH